MRKIEYVEGQVVGNNNIVFIKEVKPYNNPSGQKIRRAKFRCHCNNEFKSTITKIKTNYTKGCGCFQNDKNNHNYKHGLKKHPLYERYHAMMSRCYNSDNKDYKYYGGCGITVYYKWKNDIQSFIDYVMLLPDAGIENLTLDRIDNNSNYKPGNLRWISQRLQILNRKKQCNNTSKYVGVVFHKKINKWQSTISVNGHRIYLGCYTIKEDAINARNNYIIASNLTDYKIQSFRN